MEPLRNKIGMNSNSEISKLQIDLHTELQALRSEATLQKTLGSTDYQYMLVDAIQKNYRQVWEVILDTTDEYFKKNIFSALESDEQEVTREISTLSDKLKRHCLLCLDQFSEHSTSKAALNDLCQVIEDQSINASFRRTQQLFNIIRGLE